LSSEKPPFVLVELDLTAWWEEKCREEGLERGIEKADRNEPTRGLPLDTIGEITGLDVV
jgi:hypothetical protein